ncbi:MAG: ATP-dependent sacrificial sulfur transferase LarE [Bacteroidota bacterium]|nr:MAG: ATP-dependent sacrificial sulfur transferase LarE [Bacteroidota bacterium]
MDASLKLKYEQLQALFIDLEEAVIAYSGGVDSTLLLKVAKDVLGHEVIAIIGKSDTMPEREFEDALLTARMMGIEPVVIQTKETESPDYCNNPVERCYHCKKHIFGTFTEFMQSHKLLHLVDGSNSDDLKDYRPGNKALEQFDVLSPLRDLGFTKKDIRELSKALGLSTWNKEAMACLATRIAHNDPITLQKLRMIELAEAFLRSHGFTQVRARIQQNSLRIEVNPNEVARFYEDSIRQQVIQKMKELGFLEVSIDMEGYRMGSMNKK